ncbi:cell wall anchor protein [Rufibacter sp. DG15C]|uniref:DUF4397 domain-containing protein n=1 Tax=Rufibacter sp. DG15C TaxID=1379909 RepID=UPI00078D6D71|nr:DUF4397 domain-containing protein [Rufibacter sp. DG15C]AMM51347.1 cell wall anchor protein [Rufibacter sp. DG15C]
MKKWMKLCLMAALPTLLFTTACDDDDEDAPAVEQKANVMVVHASPNAPTVDLYVDGTKVNNTALAYPRNTGYLQVETGTRNIRVTPSGSGVASAVIDANLTLAANMNYSVFAAGPVNNITAVVVEDNLTAPAAGRAHVRFIHLAPDAPNVDVVVQATNANLFSNIAFKGSTAFTPVNAGSYTLLVQPVGTDVNAVTATVNLQAGKIYTVFAKGFLVPPAGNTNTLGAEVIVNN